MIERNIYKKTTRFEHTAFQITEKLDGENIAFFKFEGVNYVAQRQSIFTFEEVLTYDKKEGLYPKLKEWLTMYHERLNLLEGRVVIGEWFSNPTKVYEDHPLFFYAFGRGIIKRIDGNLTITNLNLEIATLNFCFKDAMIPRFIGVVKRLEIFKFYPTAVDLDALYNEYLVEVEREVEGFIITRIDKEVKVHEPIKFVKNKKTTKTKGLKKADPWTQNDVLLRIKEVEFALEVGMDPEDTVIFDATLKTLQLMNTKYLEV